MSESENADDEEINSENETNLESSDDVDLKTYLKQQVKSFARQLFCACSVLNLPALFIIYEYLEADIPVRQLILNATGHIDEPKTKQANYVYYLRDATLIALIALIISTIFLLFLGRKYTVTIANLLHFVVLLLSYGIGFEKSIPYRLLLAENFLKEFSTPPYFIYLAEIASPTWRAFFMGLFSLEAAVIKGVIGPRPIPRLNVIYLFRVLVVLTSVSLLLTKYLPETPFYETLKGNPLKAEETFRWLRAGDMDMVEFNQMIARAENIREGNGVRQNLRSSTFILGLIFSLCITICSFDVCLLMEAFLYDFIPIHVHADNLTRTSQELVNILDANLVVGWNIHFYAVSLFLVFSFVVPRKIIFLASYALSILIIPMITLKLWSIDVVKKIASYCNITPALGLSQLIAILPTEIYPTALREIGVAISAIMDRSNAYMYYLFEEDTNKGWFPCGGVNRWLTYLSYFGSIFAVLFMLMFMPETGNMNIYQLEELNLSLPFFKHRKGPVDEVVDPESEFEDS